MAIGVGYQSESEDEMTIEYRCTCRKCRANWCVSEGDLIANSRKGLASGLGFASSLLSANDRETVGSILWGEASEGMSNGMRDYSRCPRCGTIDIDVTRCQL